MYYTTSSVLACPKGTDAPPQLLAVNPSHVLFRLCSAKLSCASVGSYSAAQASLSRFKVVSKAHALCCAVHAKSTFLCCIQQQAMVVAGFRTSAINVLIATSVGSEGMDFKQCQLVVAFDLPKVCV